jgi:hypothetical protein
MSSMTNDYGGGTGEYYDEETGIPTLRSPSYGGFSSSATGASSISINLNPLPNRFAQSTKASKAKVKPRAHDKHNRGVVDSAARRWEELEEGDGEYHEEEEEVDSEKMRKSSFVRYREKVKRPNQRMTIQTADSDDLGSLTSGGYSSAGERSGASAQSGYQQYQQYQQPYQSQHQAQQQLRQPQGKKKSPIKINDKQRQQHNEQQRFIYADAVMPSPPVANPPWLPQ